MRSPLVRSILVATDLTEASDNIVRTAGRLAAATGAALHVLHAFDFPATAYVSPMPGDPLGYLDVHTFEGQLREAEVAMEAQLIRALPPGVSTASRDVQIYVAHRAIADRAEAVGADLVVLGPHRGKGSGGVLGSTADRVLRTATVPCMVVHGEISLPLRRVVAPFDLSEPARGALDTAVAWAAVLGARDVAEGLPAVELRVVHVVPRWLLSPNLPFDHATVGPRLHDEVEAALSATGATAQVQVREELLFGDTPAETICEFAEREAAELVVMGTHGYGTFKRLLIGSVASGVARRAPCPVLLVPPRRPPPGEEAEAPR
jgi:nucleotide-binding universal stress UspA family protein